MPISPGLPAALSPGLPGDREGDRERAAAAGRPAALRALAVRRAGRQPRHRAAGDRGARRRRPRRGPRARLVRHRRRARRAAQHADEPVGAGPLARPGGERARARAPRSGPRRIDEAEAFGIAPGAELFELRRLRMLDGLPISLDHNRVPLRLVPGAGRPGLHAPRRSTTRWSARATRSRAPTTSSRPAARTRPRPSCWDWRRVRRSCSRRRSRSARTAGSSTSAVPCTAPIATGSRRR